MTIEPPLLFEMVEWFNEKEHWALSILIYFLGKPLGLRSERESQKIPIKKRFLTPFSRTGIG
jgi:hypothetical protein